MLSSDENGESESELEAKLGPAEPEGTFNDFLTLSDEYLEYNPTKVKRIQNIIIDHDEEEIGTEISKSITVILKAVTHRGTQTIIQCRPDESRANFLNMIINMKV